MNFTWTQLNSKPYKETIAHFYCAQFQIHVIVNKIREKIEFGIESGGLVQFSLKTFNKLHEDIKALFGLYYDTPEST